ncbi:GNAT family N-acetyltransferase [Nocardioides sp. JQ2195]|uniref:GNAT family N-acetyltransferase n=1 Tax=Nocardioides sp. JQ2195 TaxID=2592334 RepID=UPI00143EB23C|nr:GNAT family N-acetyltransferase [Nocardioides sp. JQ2195]QIX27692.1 GNAT family N-acetyltransferase [Nocardioides sp. JQ2195]
MGSVGDSHDVGRHTLGPHVVGKRVVVRRLVRGETGPTGGPAMTDLLGICTSWGARACVVAPESGPEVTIPLADIVSGKPVPPRPSVRHRVSARDAELHSLTMWPDVPTRALGDWVLRSDVTPEEIARAGSVLAMGDPGMPYADAAAATVDFYTPLGRPAWAQVVVDSEQEHALRSLGWVAARPDEADTLFQVVALSRLHRALPTPPDGIDVEDDGVRAVAAFGDRARARAAVDDDWLGLHDIWTSPEARRQGLSTLLLAELVDWGASLGATTAYLQVRSDNTAALALYERLGFVTHHAYRYLAAR